MLNKAQVMAAQGMLAERPPVIDGTRAILDEVEAKVWHHKVARVMNELQIRTPDEVNEFCSLAGVAD